SRRQQRRSGLPALGRDDFSSNRHHALASSWSMIFFRKPVPTPHQVRGRLFRDHVLAIGTACAARLWLPNLTEANRFDGSNNRAPMHIGLIGGIGPAATDYYYRGLIEGHAAAGRQLDLTIAHADVRELIANLGQGRRDAQAAALLALVKRLQAAGAQA